MKHSKHRHLESKVFGPDDRQTLQRRIQYWRFKDRRIVFTNGCFDLLHAGHVDYLARAADLGSVLLVGLNTDDSVRRIKGANRPLNGQDARALVLASLSFVNAVVLFEEDTPAQIVQTILPDVLVKGDDYSPGDIAGADTVRRHGGQVLTIPLLKGFSTSGLIEKIKLV